MNTLSAIKGILFDLDGVLYIDAKAIDGAIEAVEKIRASGIACRFITNTSTLSLASLQKKMNALGFSILGNELISAPQATLLYLKKQQNPICHLLLAEDIKKDFELFKQPDAAPNYVVIGDIGDQWSYALLNQVFNYLMQGAKLIAIHKNRFWQTEGGLQMDIGGFVDALEYASGTKAMMIGKPSADFFQIALDDLQLKSSEVAMIGDDIDVDIGGAQHVGIKGVLVKTGKYRQHYVEASKIKPDLIIDSIKDFPELLGL